MSEIVTPGKAGTVAISSSGTSKSVSFVDRHPLLNKPREYYDNTKSNKAVKTASAAFVGVPVGIVGELKQIVVGQPSGATSTQ